jgi:predicted nucleotidyltransferase
MAQLTTDIGSTIAQDPQLAEIVKRLVAAYSPERVFLFGSRARGEVGPDSDYDLLVVVPDDSSQERATSRLGYQALRGTGVAADVVVWRRSSFERRAHVRTSLPYAALHEGVVLHGG